MLITCGEFDAVVDFNGIEFKAEIDGEVIVLPIDVENKKIINLNLGESVEVANEGCFLGETFKIKFSCN